MSDLAEAVDPLERALLGRELVDLTLTIAEDLPCSWPTHMPFQAKIFNWFADRPDDAVPLVNRSGDPYQTRWLLIDEHTGTHVDAPSHFIPPAESGLANAGPNGRISTDQLPLDLLFGSAAVVDVSGLNERGQPGKSPRIEDTHLISWEDEHGPFREGEIVLLRSDWDQRYRPGSDGSGYSLDPLVTGTSPGWPSPTRDAVAHLLERGVRCLGTDGVSIGAVDEGEEAHVAGLANGMVFIEALGQLKLLPPRGVFFLFLPIKVRGGTGGPGRAIAFLPTG